MKLSHQPCPPGSQWYFERLGTSVRPTRSSTGVLSTVPRVLTLNEDMGRCVYCHSVVTKDEDSCFVCGDSVPRQVRSVVKRRPVSGWTNTIFLASLGFTAYCFFGE